MSRWVRRFGSAESAAAFLRRSLEGTPPAPTDVGVLDIDGTVKGAREEDGRCMAALVGDACDEVHYITARAEATRAATQAWLVEKERAGALPVHTALHMREGSSRDTSADYKYAQRLSIAGNGKRVQINVGDQLSDLASIEGLCLLQRDLVSCGLLAESAIISTTSTWRVIFLYADLLAALPSCAYYVMHGYDPTTNFAVKLPSTKFVP